MKGNKSLHPQQAAERLDRYFQKKLAKRDPKPLQIRVFSQSLGLDYTFPEGSSSQPYHIASIGKVFTSTLVHILAERGLLSIKDPIYKYLSPSKLERLFVFNARDYACEVTVEHLLGHTSGIADYFEDATKDGRSFMREFVTQPDIHWTPQSLVDFTREHQTAVGAPETVFHYSDTGYILLGLIIEAVTGKSFGENLVQEFFAPLRMDDSYLMFFTEPKNPKKPIEKIWFNKVEVSQFESMSGDWAGGGVVTTTADLLKFNQALRGGRLISSASLAQMDACTHRFRPGIYYGLGMMEIRFGEFFFLLKNLPRIYGHIGLLSTHMYYDPTHDAHILMNFGSEARMAESFQALIQIENTLQKMG